MNDPDLTHMSRALVNILGAIITGEPGGTFAFEVRKVIHAVPAILASVWRLGAKWNFCLAVLTLKKKFSLPDLVHTIHCIDQNFHGQILDLAYYLC